MKETVGREVSSKVGDIFKIFSEIRGRVANINMNGDSSLNTEIHHHQLQISLRIYKEGNLLLSKCLMICKMYFKLEQEIGIHVGSEQVYFVNRILFGPHGISLSN